MSEAKGHRKGGRCYRRLMTKHKDQRLRNMIRTERWYYPYRGYINWGFVDGVWQETGKYIKYPKNSIRQQYLKKLSSAINKHFKFLIHIHHNYTLLLLYYISLHKFLQAFYMYLFHFYIFLLVLLIIHIF